MALKVHCLCCQTSTTQSEKDIFWHLYHGIKSFWKHCAEVWTFPKFSYKLSSELLCSAMWYASIINQFYGQVQCPEHSAFPCQLSFHHCSIFIFSHLPSLLCCPDTVSITKYTADGDIECITGVCQINISSTSCIWLPSFYYSFWNFAVFMQTF